MKSPVYLPFRVFDQLRPSLVPEWERVLYLLVYPSTKCFFFSFSLPFLFLEDYYLFIYFIYLFVLLITLPFPLLPIFPFLP